MPKRNLIIIGAFLAATVVISLTTHSPIVFLNNGDTNRLGGVAHAQTIIRDNFYRVPDVDWPARTPTSAPTDLHLARSMVEGMVSGLKDPFSRYIPPEDAPEFDSLSSGRIGGLGIRFEVLDDEVRVIGCVPHSPAHNAGILPGDVLLTAGTVPLPGRTRGEIHRLLDGPIGSQVTLALRRGEAIERLDIPRQELVIESVQGLYRDAAGQWVCLMPGGDKLGYVRIKEFLPDTAERLQSSLRTAMPLEGLILDLRDNPGGKFESALAVADLFLKRGSICTVFGRSGPPQRYSAREKAQAPEYPVVVLINSHSASGAEIVAGALAVNDRAVLLGTRTRGKGCMQRAFKLDPELGQISLTTSEYVVGDDQPITRRPGSDNWGVDPHVEVTMADSLKAELDRMRLELELAPWPRVATTAPSQPATAAAYSLHLVERDRQLFRAVDLLEDPAEMQDLLKRAHDEREAARALKAKKAAQAATRKAAEP